MLHPIIAGVDPGLVHTGLVVMEFDTTLKKLTVRHAVIDGLNSTETLHHLIDFTTPRPLHTVDTYIEWYRARSGFGVDERMVQANVTFKDALRGTLLRNTGVKKIVSKKLMELCQVWNFSTSTHHQDLRSAARIGLLGMMLDPPMNKVLYDFAVDNVDGREWDVEHGN